MPNTGQGILINLPIASKKVRLDFEWVWGVSDFRVGASNFRVELPPTFKFAGQLKESPPQHSENRY